MLERRPARRAKSDLSLVRAVITGKDGAWDQFLKLAAGTIYTACRLAFPGDEAEPAFLDMLKRLQADDYARLRTYDGRAPLVTFLALILREELSSRVFSLLSQDKNKGWRLFEYFFDRDIEQLAKAHHAACVSAAGEFENVPDWIQKIKTALVEDDFARLMKYNGSGSFGGYVRGIVRNLCVECQRALCGRRRLPAAIARMPELEQEVFRQIYWHGKDPQILMSTLATIKEPVSSGDQIAAAISRVTQAVPRDYTGRLAVWRNWKRDLPARSPTPH